MNLSNAEEQLMNFDLGKKGRGFYEGHTGLLSGAQAGKYERWLPCSKRLQEKGAIRL